MKQHILSTVFVLLSALSASSQWYKPALVDRAAFEMFLQAYEHARYDEFDKALPLLNKALTIDNKFVEAYIGKGNIFSRQKKYADAIEMYGIAKGLDSVFFKQHLPAYALALAGVGRFKDALNETNEFLANINISAKARSMALQRKKNYEFAIEKNSSIEQQYTFTPIRFSDSVNSNNLEYYPSFPIEANKIIFTRRVGNNEDFYESRFINGQWQNADPLNGAVNTGFNEGAQSISADGKMMVFAGCDYPRGFGSCDLYVSYFDDSGKWSSPQNLGKAVNTDFWESAPTIAADKTSIYFSSNRPGGIGGQDIWVTRFKDGEWQKAQNVGIVINTKGDDGSPFLHADGQTLYFSSNGHLGYGGSDLFVSRKDSSGDWGMPVNLGYPINTIDEEASIVILPDGKTAWYASDRFSGSQGLDLYQFTLRRDLSATKTIWVKGRVVDRQNGKPTSARLELSEVPSGKSIEVVEVKEDGSFLVVLPQGRDYAFNVNKKGYLFFSQNFPLKSHPADSIALIQIAIQKLEKGAKAVLRNIFFDTREITLRPESKFELDKLVTLLSENPTIKIQVEGHTDNVGTPKDNLQLSIGRALAVKNYLISKGVNSVRILHKGFGELKPIVSNMDEAGRSQNRRTEILVL